MATGRGWDREAAEAARRETLDRLHAMLAEQVGSLESTSRWEAWLRFAHSFHRYSFSNTLLIMVQRPDATVVSGYRSWLARGRQVRRGETAIRVLGPVTRRVDLTDPNGRPLLDENGKPRTHLQVVGVKPVSVFDVLQNRRRAAAGPADTATAYRPGTPRALGVADRGDRSRRVHRGPR